MAAKFFVALLGFAAVISATSGAPPPVGDEIADKVKKIILDAMASIGDPFTISKDTAVTIPDNEFISGLLTVHTATIKGLSSTTIPTLVVDILGTKINGEADLTNFVLDATAHQKVKTGADSYDDECAADFTLKGLKITFSGGYDIFKGHVKDVKVTAKLTSSTFDKLTGFLGSDEESAKLAAALTENLATWINNDTKYFPILSTVIQNAINAYLDANKKVADQLTSVFAQ